MIEKELKIILSEDQYNILYNKFNWDLEVYQKNHYYIDENNLDEEHKITIRIREIGETLRLQLKIPVKRENSLHIKREVEKEIDSIPEKLSGEFLSELADIKIGDVKLVGNLNTTRLIYKWDSYTELCLDKNEYLNAIDYEMEIEYEEEISKEIFEMLDFLNIKYDQGTIGKCSRFMNRYNEDSKQKSNILKDK